jgi:cysteine desulfuration protein SufE
MLWKRFKLVQYLLNRVSKTPDFKSGVFFSANHPQMKAMTIDQIAQDLRDEFDFLDDWETRYAHLIDLGKANTPLKASERIEETRVRGCASQVWLVSDFTDEGKLHLRAESDAMIVSGLIALLIRLYSGQPAKHILKFDIHALLDEIGVSGALTAQRSNGLASMLERIHKDARMILAD